MKTQQILVKNAAYQKLEVIKTNRNKRYKYNAFFVEGVRNINQAIKNNWVIESFLYSFEAHLSDWAAAIINSVQTSVNYALTVQLMAALSSKEDTSELLAIVRMREDSIEQLHLSDTPLLALFDRPSNKGNLGTILRSCDALGIEALIITGHAVDIYDPETISASMGSFFKVPFLRLSDNATVITWIDRLKQTYPRFSVIATTSHHQNPVYTLDLTGPLLLMLGNETEGLCNKFYEISDQQATIPMAENSSASSFNVACAATVLFYEAERQRKNCS